MQYIKSEASEKPPSKKTNINTCYTCLKMPKKEKSVTRVKTGEKHIKHTQKRKRKKQKEKRVGVPRRDFQ